jgi:ELWxxDGT repeat protein
MKFLSFCFFGFSVFANTIHAQSIEFDNKIVRNINISEVSQNQNSVLNFGNKVLFRGYTDSTGYEPWVSDGTEEGTFMLKDILVGKETSFYDPHKVVYESNIFFTAHTSSNISLWKTDGTQAGTVKVEGLQTESDYSKMPHICLFKGNIYLMARMDNSGLGSELYKVNPHDLSVTLVKDINPGYAHTSMSSFIAFENEFYFFAYTPDLGNELWRSDGTSSGTYMVKDIAPGTGSSVSIYNPRIAQCNNIVFFAADNTNSGNSNNALLWRTDGTPTGTYKIEKQVGNSLQTFSRPDDYNVFGNKLYFTTKSSSNTKTLWCYFTDTDNIVSISQHISPINPLIKTGNKLLFFKESNGLFEVNTLNNTIKTRHSTLIAENEVTNEKYPYINYAVSGESFYFNAKDNNTNGFELWKTDSTSTKMVFNVAKGKKNKGFHSSNCREIRVFNNKLFFTADDGIYGRELWVADENNIGAAHLVKNINKSNTIGSNPTNFKIANHQIYFSASTITKNHQSDPIYNDVYRYDTEKDSLFLIFESDESSNQPNLVTVFNDRLLFSGNGYLRNTYYEKLDKTGFDIFPISLESKYPNAIINNELIFSASTHNSAKNSLYKINQAGTLQLVSTKPTSIWSMADLNNVLYFQAQHQTFPQNGVELWRSDGTDAGTFMLKDIRSGYDSGLNRGRLFKAGNYIYFGASNNSDGTELWRTDGTLEGTIRVATLSTASNSPIIYFLTTHDNKVFFGVSDEGNGRYFNRLWVSDLNSLLTSPISDFGKELYYYDWQYSNPTVSHGYCYFNTTYGENPLWRINLQNYSVTTVKDRSNNPIKGNVVFGDNHYVLFTGKILDPSTKNYISGIGYIDSNQQNVKIIKADFFASNIYQIGDEGYFAGMKNEETEFWKVKLCPFSLNLNTSLGAINETTSITVHTHITVTGKAPLTSNNNLSAGNSILLMPGFETTGNSFKADINGCKY